MHRLHKPEDLVLDQIKQGQKLRETNVRKVSELAKSIETNGLLQPILVRPVGASFEIVFGQHRFEACKQLGWKTIPAMTKQMSVDECFLTRIVENLQRNEEINPIAEAKGYIELINHGWTINRIAERVGKSDSYVSDRIGLIRRLHPDLANRMHSTGNSHLTPSHLELLARLRSKRSQIELSDLVERKRLRVRRLECMISGGQPFKENVKKFQGSLYIRVPEEILEHMKLKEGDTVCIYSQSRKRVAIERPTVQKPRRDACTLTKSVSTQITA